MAITPELTVCPITGFKAEFGGDFAAYMRRLAKDIEEDMKKPEKIRNKMYDMQKGNPGNFKIEWKSVNFTVMTWARLFKPKDAVS